MFSVCVEAEVEAEGRGGLAVLIHQQLVFCSRRLGERECVFPLLFFFWSFALFATCASCLVPLAVTMLLQSWTVRREDVVRVTGQSFLGDVVESGSEVVLQVYAPWCEHCKRFDPVFSQVGE